MENIIYVGVVRDDDWKKKNFYIGSDFERAKDIVLAERKSGVAIVELWVGQAVIQSFRYNTYHKEWVEEINLESQSISNAKDAVDKLTDSLGNLGIVSDAISGLEDHESISILLGSLNTLREACLDLSVKANEKAAKKANEADGGFYIGKD